MKNKTYFIISVSFAIILPICIGVVYFYNVYLKDSKMQILKKYDTTPELIIYENNIDDVSNDNIIKNDSYYKNIKPINFEVRNISKRINNYSLYLNNIVINSSINTFNLKWKLFKIDEIGEKEVSDGNFDNIVDSHIKILNNVKIFQDDIHRYTLYCYLVDDNEIEKSQIFKAEIVLE